MPALAFDDDFLYECDKKTEELSRDYASATGLECAYCHRSSSCLPDLVSAFAHSMKDLQAALRAFADRYGDSKKLVVDDSFIDAYVKNFAIELSAITNEDYSFDCMPVFLCEAFNATKLKQDIENGKFDDN